MDRKSGAGAQEALVHETYVKEDTMAVVYVLLILGLLLGLLGALIEGLYWLMIVGVVLVLATAVFALSKAKSEA